LKRKCQLTIIKSKIKQLLISQAAMVCKPTKLNLRRRTRKDLNTVQNRLKNKKVRIKTNKRTQMKLPRKKKMKKKSKTHVTLMNR
jgi:hypothetical protein